MLTNPMDCPDSYGPYSMFTGLGDPMAYDSRNHLFSNIDNDDIFSELNQVKSVTNKCDPLLSHASDYMLKQSQFATNNDKDTGKGFCFILSNSNIPCFLPQIFCSKTQSTTTTTLSMVRHQQQLHPATRAITLLAFTQTARCW